jgi:DNA-binding transcriptional MerR regulator
VAEPTPDTTRRALLKSADVCELAKVQPYVLRSWEKEFPDLGTTRAAGGPRYYRRADVDRVLRIKQLVFGEGLTLAGARRKLDEERAAQVDDELPFEEVVVAAAPAVSAETKARIEGVRQGLRALLEMLAARRQSTNGSRISSRLEADAPPLLPMEDDAPAETDAARKLAGKRRKRSVAAAK